MAAKKDVIDQYRDHLTKVGKSPHTVRAYSHDLAAITGHRSAEPFDRPQDRLAPCSPQPTALPPIGDTVHPIRKEIALQPVTLRQFADSLICFTPYCISLQYMI